MHDEGVANGSNFLDMLPAWMLNLSRSSWVEFKLGICATVPSKSGNPAPLPSVLEP